MSGERSAWKYTGQILLAGILWGCMGLFVRPYDEKGLTSLSVAAILASIEPVVAIVLCNVKGAEAREKATAA